jgi:hypothetical protein
MKKNYSFLLGFWFLFLAGIGLRIYNLDLTLGPGDENQYLLDYGNTPFQYIATTFFYGGHHIFHTLVMRLMIVLFSDENAIAIRFPAFICGVGTLFVVYKISQILFKSKITPFLSLAIIVLSPIHIYYSNIARGYSFIIFFSALMILAALRIFESGRFGIWGWVLSISAFMSTYTIATNVYFVFALGCWIALVVFVPSLFKETSFIEDERKKIVIGFLTIFIAAGLMTLSAYWPVLSQMTNEAKDYHLPMTAYSSNFQTVYGIIENLFDIVFVGKLMFFSPFVILGIFSTDVRKNSYRILAVFILIIPFLVPLFTGVGGYGRNFLFDIIIVIPFLAAGLISVGFWLGKNLKQSHWIFKMGIVVIFFLASIWQTFFVYFPSSYEGFDLKKFREEMANFINPLDLFIIASPHNYWYSHNIYKKNLIRSIYLNKLSGIKVAAGNKEKLINFELIDGFKTFPVFKFLWDRKKIISNKTDRGFSIFSLNERNNISLLDKDFESEAVWSTVKGEGKIEIEKKTTLVGNSSLKVINHKSNEPFIVQAHMNRIIQIGNPMFVVMLWGGVELEKNSKGYNLAAPTLILENVQTKKHLALRMAKINDGIFNYVGKNSENDIPKWMISAFIGIILQGEFNIKLQAAALENQTALFDGISLFLFDVPSKK